MTRMKPMVQVKTSGDNLIGLCPYLHQCTLNLLKGDILLMHNGARALFRSYQQGREAIQGLDEGGISEMTVDEMDSDTKDALSDLAKSKGKERKK
jgi:hypothetical protein